MVLAGNKAWVNYTKKNNSSSSLSSKNFFPSIMTLHFFAFMVEGKRCLFAFQCFDMIKQKVFLLPQNSDRINNLHIALVTTLLLYNDIYSKYCYFKTRFAFLFCK